MFNNEYANKQYREFLEEMRNVFNQAADGFIYVAELSKVLSQIYQPNNKLLIQNWKGIESDLRKTRIAGNAYYDIRVSNYP